MSLKCESDKIDSVCTAKCLVIIEKDLEHI